MIYVYFLVKITPWLAHCPLRNMPPAPPPVNAQNCEQPSEGSHRVTDIQEPASLASLAVDGERVAHCRLHHEAVESCAEDAVVVVAVDEHGVRRCLLRANAVHDALCVEKDEAKFRCRNKCKITP